MKKIIKVLAVLMAVVLIGAILFIANAFVGNPISKMIVSANSKKYIEEQYPNMDYYITRVSYSFKTGGYYAYVKSKSSEDTNFSVSYSSLGKVGYDNYESRVADGFNTWDRINHQYGVETSVILDELPYESDICYARIESGDKGEGLINFGLDMASLELDKNYDLKDMGAKYGKVTIYVCDKEVSEEKAAEILMYIKKAFEKEDESFYAIDLALREPRDADTGKFDGEEIRVECFLWESIAEDSIAGELQKAIEATKKYYKEMDEEKSVGKG